MCENGFLQVHVAKAVAPTFGSCECKGILLSVAEIQVESCFTVEHPFDLQTTTGGPFVECLRVKCVQLSSRGCTAF